MINTLLQSSATVAAGQIVEVSIINSARRRIAEVAAFYAWGVLGMLGCLLFARQAVEFQNSVDLDRRACIRWLIRVAHPRQGVFG
jgi:hypothetical protein